MHPPARRPCFLPAFEPLEPRLFLSGAAGGLDDLTYDPDGLAGLVPGQGGDGGAASDASGAPASAALAAQPAYLSAGELRNSPIGVARGIFPGRVAWVYDPTATPWNGSTGNWWSDAGTNQTSVDRMMSTGLRSVTGAVTDTAAWDALFKSFNQGHGKGTVGYAAGEKVVIKINLNNSGGYGDTDNQLDASPHTVLSMVRQLVYQAGVPQNMITLYDAVRAVPDKVYNKVHAEFPNVTFVDSTGTNGRTLTQWQANVITYSVSNGCGTRVPTCVTQANYLINMALLKGHNNAGVTLTAKNHYGSIDAREHTYIHSAAQPMGTYSPFVDLIGDKDLGGKTLLFMIDALYGTNDVSNGPARWQQAPFNNGWTSSFFMSQDPIAIDSVGVDFLLSEFGSQSFMTNSDNYLHEGALANAPPSGTAYHPDGTPLASLGTHEHWDSNTSRQYSRNLGTGNGIELVSIRPDAAAPAAPTNLGATVISSAQVDLAWTDNSDNESGFKVERATSNDFSLNLTLLVTTAAGVNHYSDTTVAPSTPYFYRVRATNWGVDSTNSNTAPATTPSETAPAAPSGLAAVASPGQVQLTWTCHSTNDRGFKIERAANLGFTRDLTLWTTTVPHATSYTDTTAAPSTAYFYRVRATNTAGDSANSNTASATTPGVLAGLAAEFFDFTSSLSLIPDLTSRTPDVARVDTLINYPSTTSAWSGLSSQFADTFASRHTGYVKITTAGDYTFYLNSDDGSKMWLDGLLVINNDGLHAMIEVSAMRTLAAGYHSLRVEFFENDGGAGLIMSWAGPGIGKVVAPASVLFHDGTLIVGENWTGGASNHWEGASNWSSVMVPGMQTTGTFSGPVTTQPKLYADEGVKGVVLASAGWNLDLAGHTLFVGSGGLSIAGGANPTSKVNLGTGSLIVDYADGGPSPRAQIEGYVKAGMGPKDAIGRSHWDGTGGIMSSTANANYLTAAVGVMDNTFDFEGSRPVKTTFGGQTVDATSVLVRYTWWGDMNLDGKVDYNDVSILVYYYYHPPAADKMGWQTGDLNYDGVINYDDVSLMVYGYYHQGGPLGEAAEAAPMEVTGATMTPATSGTVTVTSQILSAGGQAAIPISGETTASAQSNASQPAATSTDLAILPPDRDNTEATDEIVLTVNVG